MSTPPKEHNCPILNIFKDKSEGCGCGCNTAPPSQNPETETAVEPQPPVADTVTDDTPSDEQAKQLLADLQAFDSDPKAFMDRQLVKRTEQPGETATTLPLFDKAAIDGKEYVAARDELRTLLEANDTERSSRAAFNSNDLAQNLVDTLSYTGLQSMQSNNLMQARLSVQPWSDDYWAICRGILGKRYADPGFPNTYDWQQCHNYVQTHPASSVPVNSLSPSEKYDRLVGDNNYTLTKKMWAEGQAIYQSNGSVAAWMGICHGWAPAAYMLPRPTNAVTVLAADGHTQITFYPSDIKALASLLWARVPSAIKFIGGRCNTANPARDANGRLLDQSAFDTNPGTWHLAIVNQIGASKRGMVMDVTYDYEVWNQPVLGYRYRHFNPQSMTYQSSLSAAAVSRANYTRDKFSSYHSNQTASIVGIEMYVSYMVETQPSHSSPDSASHDAIKEVRYLYDLELDVSGRIIGGEWRSFAHPDFLWTPVKGGRAQTAFEPGGSWDRNGAVPSSWKSAAVSASSSNRPAPLAAIVEHLIRFANNG
ncbi:hypothetical protein [Candidatus Electronema sp. PJ]|uniref:hypothetical protein n=1 Tax=Candidatus Electronema sp. PJ TaxID=3401572 RepID=UPI003AA9DE68